MSNGGINRVLTLIVFFLRNLSKWMGYYSNLMKICSDHLIIRLLRIHGINTSWLLVEHRIRSPLAEVQNRFQFQTGFGPIYEAGL